MMTPDETLHYVKSIQILRKSPYSVYIYLYIYIYIYIYIMYLYVLYICNHENNVLSRYHDNSYTWEHKWILLYVHKYTSCNPILYIEINNKRFSVVLLFSQKVSASMFDKVLNTPFKYVLRELIKWSSKSWHFFLNTKHN